MISNLHYLRQVTGPATQAYDPEHSDLFFKRRFEYVYRQARRFYTKGEVDQAATNRRSKSTPDAVIKDFQSFEQPVHIIPKDAHFWIGLNMTREMFKPNRPLHPISYPDLRYYPWNLQPSAEAPWTLPDFKFRPNYRDVDQESEIPKLRQKFEKLAFHIDPTAKIKVPDYLRIKQSLGLIDNARPSFHNLYSEIFYINRTHIHKIKDGNKPFFKDGVPQPYYWHTLHARAHVVAKDEDDKIRAVFGTPKLVLMAENMFIWPLQATYLNTSAGKMLWGREMLKGGWKKLFRESSRLGQHNTFMTLDWSQFDKRLLFELMTHVHSIWRSYFDFSVYEPTSFYPHSTTNPQRIENLWNWMTNTILHTPILLPNGELWEWLRNGFGSGFQQTQLMDTFGNSIMILTCLSALGINIQSEGFWIRIQGDDSVIGLFERIYSLYGPGFINQIEAAALFYFNAKLNIKKSEVGSRLSSMTVLGYHNHYGLPYRTDEDLLRHLMFPEHVGNYDSLYSSVIGLAYANLGSSERFHNLCDYIKKKMEAKHEKGIANIHDNRHHSMTWMLRMNAFDEEEHFRIRHSQNLPSRMQLRALCWIMKENTETQKQRIWPTDPGTKGNFYFPNPL
jgi:hypothetical protein